jgi:hypothetical protein
VQGGGRGQSRSRQTPSTWLPFKPGAGADSLEKRERRVCFCCSHPLLSCFAHTVGIACCGTVGGTRRPVSRRYIVRWRWRWQSYGARHLMMHLCAARMVDCGQCISLLVSLIRASTEQSFCSILDCRAGAFYCSLELVFEYIYEDAVALLPSIG